MGILIAYVHLLAIKWKLKEKSNFLSRFFLFKQGKNTIQKQQRFMTLVKMSNEAMNIEAEVCKEEIGQSSDRITRQINTPDGQPAVDQQVPGVPAAFPEPIYQGA